MLGRLRFARNIVNRGTKINRIYLSSLRIVLGVVISHIFSVLLVSRYTVVRVEFHTSGWVMKSLNLPSCHAGGSGFMLVSS